MPKSPSQDKKTMRKKGGTQRPRRGNPAPGARPKSLSGIMKEGGWLQSLSQVRDHQQEWVLWWQGVLPEELRKTLVNVVQKRNELTLLAVSPVWSARLRFAIEEAMPRLRAHAPDIVSVRVRVAPAGSTGQTGPTP
jgi:hypothetical protein